MNFQERPRSQNKAAPDISRPAARTAPTSSTVDAREKKNSPGASDINTPESWAKLFQGNPDPQTVRQLAKELSEAKRHNDLIALIEQAILAGQSQPWMYEVLALTMEMAGRPRSQIERVLLSNRDLTPADVESLLFLAAYLARFERFAQALQCCRQAAEVEPNRPEPYVQALRYAERLKDADALAWASVGALTYCWGRNRDQEQKQAEAAAADAKSIYQHTGDVAKLLALDQALVDARRRDLQIRLEFGGNGNLDLLVEEPGGETSSYDHPYTKGGGVFAHDGYGPNAENCYDEYVCPIAFPGEYRALVRYGWGQITGKRARLIITREAGTPEEQREIVPIEVASEDQVVRILVKAGRRKQLAEYVPVDAPLRKKPVVQQTVLQQLAPAQIVSGQAQPFATGAVPTGGGNVGYQPVVQLFNSGISMTAQAVISGDRRYVRISAVPQFNNITDVFTFSPVTGGAGGGQN